MAGHERRDKLNQKKYVSIYLPAIMKNGETVGKIPVSEIQDNGHVKVIRSEAFNPSFFWIQLCSNLSEFKKFISDLNEFYEKRWKHYQIPKEFLQTGLNIACTYAGEWHRGIIKAILPDKSCIIHFYDYGTVKSYQPGELYYLHRRFSLIPAQAIPCGLYNLRPYNCDKWRKEVTWKFIEKTSCPLIAEIISKNDKENSALITLKDTQKDDFHINDWMHSEKLASPGYVSIDLKNLIHYEEDKLSGKDNICEEELESFSSPKAKVHLSPGFSSPNTIPQESPNIIINGLQKNLVENIVGNSKMGGKEFLDLEKRIQNQMSPIEYKAFLQHLFEIFQIPHSSVDDSQNSGKINSEIPEFNNFDAQQKGATYLNYETLNPDDLKKELENRLETLKNYESVINLNKKQISNLKNSPCPKRNQLKQDFFSLSGNKEKNTNFSFVNEKTECIPNNIFFPDALNPDSPNTNEDLMGFPEPETELKETNPFKMFLKEKNSSCVNLNSFFDAPFDESSNTNEPNAEYSNTLNNKFFPDADSCANKISDIFYEFDPLMCNRNGQEKETDKLDPEYWKSIPSFPETSGTSRSHVEENGFSFKVNKLKTPVEQKDFYSLHKDLLQAGSYPLPSSSENSSASSSIKDYLI